jgi:hypothetical protein
MAVNIPDFSNEPLSLVVLLVSVLNNQDGLLKLSSGLSDVNRLTFLLLNNSEFPLLLSYSQFNLLSRSFIKDVSAVISRRRFEDNSENKTIYSDT